MNKKGILMVVSGPSGAGKGTVVKRFRELVPEIGFSVSATTREPREGEVDGKDYYFVSRDEFLRMIGDGEMLEYTEFCGNFYGTPKKEADRAKAAGVDLILEIESTGAFNVKKVDPDAVLVMIMPDTLTELGARLRGRESETEEVILRRLATAGHEVALAEKYDYILVNETGKADECAEGLKAILMAEHQRSSRMKDAVDRFMKQ